MRKHIKYFLTLALAVSLLIGNWSTVALAEDIDTTNAPVADENAPNSVAPNVVKVLVIEVVPLDDALNNPQTIELYLSDKVEVDKVDNAYVQSLIPSTYELSDFVVRDLTPEEQTNVADLEFFEGINFEANPEGEFTPQIVETIFDIGSLTLSVTEFATNPTFWNGFKVVMDGAAVVIPGVPSINGAARMIKASATLKQSMQVGIMRYGTMTRRSIPANWERHHIFEERFASRLGVGTRDMLTIAIPGTMHQRITNAMRAKYPYGTDYSKLTQTQIINAHINMYRDLKDATKSIDEKTVYEFLEEFARHRQITPKK